MDFCYEHSKKTISWKERESYIPAFQLLSRRHYYSCRKTYNRKWNYQAEIRMKVSMYAPGKESYTMKEEPTTREIQDYLLAYKLSPMQFHVPQKDTNHSPNDAKYRCSSCPWVAASVLQ